MNSQDNHDEEGQLVKQVRTLKLFEDFQKQYDKTSHALQASIDRELKLISTCRELKTSLVASACHTRMTIKQQEIEMKSIYHYRQECEAAWNASEQAKLHEEKALELIQQLKEEIKTLNDQVYAFTKASNIENSSLRSSLSSSSSLTSLPPSSSLSSIKTRTKKNENLGFLNLEIPNIPTFDEWKRMNSLWVTGKTSNSTTRNITANIRNDLKSSKISKSNI